MTELSVYHSLHESYPLFRESTLTGRFFKHTAIKRLMRKHSGNPLYEITTIGSSFERRAIHCIKAGNGKIKILLWSQMHGDEPTATMAIADCLNFFAAENDGFDGIRKRILVECTLYFVPMLNPDGAERYARRNAQDIDINRDFLKLQSPEAQVLRKLRDDIRPHFGFNLHDQSVKWSAGATGHPAAFSLLAPASDEALTIDLMRMCAIQVCCCLNNLLKEFLPGHIGRFKDDYEPRSFGDNFQAAGTSTILIETGGYPYDPEKQLVRKTLFLSLLYGFQVIAEDSFTHETTENYFAIPGNTLRHFSILIKNCEINSLTGSYTVDIGLLSEPGPSITGERFRDLLVVDDIGDLSGFFGYEMIDAAGCVLVPGTPPRLGEPANITLTKEGLTVLSVADGKIIVRN